MIDARGTLNDSDADELPALLREAICGMSSAPSVVEARSGSIEPGDTVDERYAIVSRLARGGMGEVFVAQHVVTGKRVALKRILGAPGPRASARLLREARAASKIQHPNVVSVLDAGNHRGHPYLVMELLQGESLAARVARGPVALDALLGLFQGIASGVAAAHAQGVLHRDLKPANIFLCASDDGAPPLPKVLDFGIAQPLDEAGDRLTEHGQHVGTPGFMPPEQLRGETVGVRADVYALCVTLYFCLAQKLPFEGATRAALCGAILHGRATPLRAHVPSAPRSLERVLARGLARDPAERFDSVAALVQALNPLAPEEAAARRLRGLRGWGMAGLGLLTVLGLAARNEPELGACEGRRVEPELAELQPLHEHRASAQRVPVREAMPPARAEQQDAGAASELARPQPEPRRHKRSKLPAPPAPEPEAAAAPLQLMPW